MKFLLRKKKKKLYIHTYIHNVHKQALTNIGQNFNPKSDGSSGRIRKWIDCINACNIMGFDEKSSAKMRSILQTVTGKFGKYT